MTITESLIELIRGKGIGEADRQRSTFFMLDAIANANAGRNTTAGKKLMQWGAQQGSDAGRRAFVIGGLTHILESDDLHRASVTHPGCVVVPAVLAVAEGKELHGRALLDAVLHGFEAMCRVGNAVGAKHYEVWHNTATCGPYGSAMATATLTGLDDEQTMHALGNAGTQSSGLWEFLETGAMSKHLHAGRAAESGVIAAQLAAFDFTGPPTVLEGRKGFFVATCPDAIPQAVLSAPDQPWQLLQTSIKPWPSCRHTHPAVDAALELHDKLANDSIDAVTIETYQTALDVCNHPTPQSEYEAKFSLHHTVAAALTDGRLTFDSFDQRKCAELTTLCERITIAASEPFASAYPASWGARVSVRTHADEYISAERDCARGDPELALDDREMIEKAEMLLDFAHCNPTMACRIIDGVLGLAQMENSKEFITFLNKQLCRQGLQQEASVN